MTPSEPPPPPPVSLRPKPGTGQADSNLFLKKLAQHTLHLERNQLETLQVNVGRKCNQACRHCHVDAAPWRQEMMPERVARKVGEWMLAHQPSVVDITGGAPEINPHFRYLVETARQAGSKVIDRNNLTIIEEPGFGWLPEYLAQHAVEVVGSLPCYSAENVARQRGQGVFAKSISALKKLNAVGYGTRLPIHLVYNPIGPTLPGDQAELEADYKEALQRDQGVIFNRLFTVTNQPIARFAEDLRRSGQWDAYLELLANSFNPATVENVMCRSLLSVGWMGEIYDCDFNQMLGFQLRNGKPLFLWDVEPDKVRTLPIRTGIHCLACTAGRGSSCTGALD